MLAFKAEKVKGVKTFVDGKVKGFIGPIGDDLPSLIPLIFALVVFFSSFNAAMQTFEKRNSDFVDDLDALKVARILRSNGYISSLEEFKKICSLITVKSINFEAGLMHLNVSSPFTPSDLFYNGVLKKPNELFIKPEGETYDYFVCPSERVLENLEVPLTIELFNEGRALIRVYPMVLEEKTFPTGGVGGTVIVKPVQLVVVSWR